MAVIALVGNKGGAGKTTLAINLATGLAHRAAEPTIILDADPQGSSLQWRAFAESDTAPGVIAAQADLERLYARRRRDYRHIVIDCPPSVHAPQTLAALRLCDVALIPVQPSPLDLWATVHIERAVAQAREVNPDLRAWLVINQLEPRTKLSRLIRQALDELDLPAAQTAVRRRAAYRASVLEGRTVLDLGRRGAEAAEEINNLISEVIAS